ncbi:NAD(P)H-binding protein [Williamsia maris]|uniref:Uncharacterized conserved protein YbjT, contains NAD(P)-binding and DUF2867 domains n=1 Tax=Williamsia maris TaxID=72806 RepID=A0ABT1HD04_9NOCA|nr:NAD(P)H-binding protein [Williamsia maris]MCP2175595.1 Uncharacterized conserved protein YbjT, contains NAD(P)-binding and DUF2867 domains [Williamsia maris]
MKVLVTGASGYVGGRLVPRLLADGHDIRVTTSSPESTITAWWADQAESVTMDVLDADQVAAATDGIEAVFYLIHGMGDGDDFAETDREAAQNMAAAIDRHGIPKVVYLTGIVPDVESDDLSEHISSRLEVEKILEGSSATAVALRAAIILGSGSTSFELIRQVSERLPVQTVPSWMDSQVQPIAVTDVLDALAGSLGSDVPGGHYDIGGSETMAYSALLDTYTTIAGLTRPQVTVPLLPTALVGEMVAALTDVPSSTVTALVESLHHDMVCHGTTFLGTILPADHSLTTTEDAITRALAEPASDPAHADPIGPMPHDPDWAGGGSHTPIRTKISNVVEKLTPGS